jgi:RNA polymerase primary sigma factor
MDAILSAQINKAYKPVDNATEIDLLLKAKSGDYNAQNDLVNSQLKTIFSIARGYVSYNNPLTDLVSQGTIGLIKAIHKFDFEKAGTMRFQA